MIFASMSSLSSRMWTPFTLPTVPTGIKIGVGIFPWSVVISPARAFVSGAVASILKSIVVTLLNDCVGQASGEIRLKSHAKLVQSALNSKYLPMMWCFMIYFRDVLCGWCHKSAFVS